jgi:hypothetical protein
MADDRPDDDIPWYAEQHARLRAEAATWLTLCRATDTTPSPTRTQRKKGGR